MQLHKKRLLWALIGGVLCAGLYKLYLYNNDKEQFNDSNLLVSLVLIALPTVLIYAALSIVAAFRK